MDSLVKLKTHNLRLIPPPSLILSEAFSPAKPCKHLEDDEDQKKAHDGS